MREKHLSQLSRTGLYMFIYLAVYGTVDIDKDEAWSSLNTLRKMASVAVDSLSHLLVYATLYCI